MLMVFKAIIIQVVSKERHSHLVAIIKGSHLYVPLYSCLIERVTVPEAEGQEGLPSPWFVFNDFSVQNISEEEALSFSGKWKVRNFCMLEAFAFIMLQVPAILYLERADCQENFDYSGLSDTIDASILSQDTSISVSVSFPFPQVAFVRSQSLATGMPA
jgi:hypothetical protein